MSSGKIFCKENDEGELYKFKDKKTEQQITRMEEESGYILEKIMAKNNSGKNIEAYCFFSAEKLPATKLIASGDWLDFKKTRKFAANEKTRSF